MITSTYTMENRFNININVDLFSIEQLRLISSVG